MGCKRIINLKASISFCRRFNKLQALLIYQRFSIQYIQNIVMHDPIFEDKYHINNAFHKDMNESSCTIKCNTVLHVRNLSNILISSSYCT